METCRPRHFLDLFFSIEASRKEFLGAQTTAILISVVSKSFAFLCHGYTPDALARGPSHLDISVVRALKHSSRQESRITVPISISARLQNQINIRPSSRPDSSPYFVPERVGQEAAEAKGS